MGFLVVSARIDVAKESEEYSESKSESGSDN